MIIYSLMYFFPDLKPVCCSMSSSNCCFLTCIQISQEAGQVVSYSHLFKKFPPFFVIHVVKGFGVVNKAEVDVFLELLLFQWFNQIRWDQSLSPVRLFATPWTAARQASLSITNSRSSLRLMFIQSVMPSSYLILCHPLLLLLPIPASIRVFSNESTLHMKWPKYWSFSLSIIPSKEHPGPISFRMDWLDLLAVQGVSVF